MTVEAEVTIKGTTAAVWSAITDIGHAAESISGIEKIELIEQPKDGLVGLRWRETRIYFGKPATVEKHITEAVDNRFCTTQAESDGFVFLSTMTLSESGSGVTLTSSHDTRPQGLVARLKSIPMPLFRGILKKALLQDLTDIKTLVERRGSAAS